MTKRLGSLLAEKHDIPYSSMMGLLRCRLSFALLQSSVMCIRGSRYRSSRHRPRRIDLSTTDLAIYCGGSHPSLLNLHILLSLIYYLNSLLCLYKFCIAYVFISTKTIIGLYQLSDTCTHVKLNEQITDSVR